jgi:hypothetical protein
MYSQWIHFIVFYFLPIDLSGRIPYINDYEGYF